jgi:hypothetical protein
VVAAAPELASARNRLAQTYPRLAAKEKARLEFAAYDKPNLGLNLVRKYTQSFKGWAGEKRESEKLQRRAAPHLTHPGCVFQSLHLDGYSA